MKKIAKIFLLLLGISGFINSVYAQHVKVAQPMEKPKYTKAGEALIVLMKADSANNREHDWTAIEKALQKTNDKYYAGMVVTNAQLKQARKRKDKGKEMFYTVKNVETYGIDTAGIAYAMVNNTCWYLFFMHSNNKDTLKKAASWMEFVLKGHPDDYISMDTYANLLYKTGQTDQAVKWEEKAVQFDREAAVLQKRDPDPSIKEALEKMRKGIPTWPTQ